MPFDAGEERGRQQRLRSSGRRQMTQSVRSDPPPVPENWRLAVIHSVEVSGELTFRLLDYSSSPPAVGLYEYYGVVKTGYPVPTLAVSAFNSLTWPSGDPATDETPVVLAKRNRRGFWLLRLFGVSDGGTSATGTYVFGGESSTCAGSVLGGGTNVINDNDLFTPPGRWIARAPMGCSIRAASAGVSLGGAVLSIGGYNHEHSTTLNEVDEYRPDRWMQKAPLPADDDKTHKAAAFARASKAYMTGGGRTLNSNDAVTGDVYRYTPTSGIGLWTVQDAMSTPRMGHTAFAPQWDGYVCGGRTYNRVMLRSTERFSNGAWSATTDMPGPARRLFASFVLGDYAYATGGTDRVPFATAGSPQIEPAGALSDVDRFDPVGEVWAARGPMPIRRKRHTASAIGQNGYVFSGDNGSALEASDVRKFDPTGIGTWSDEIPMVTPPRILAGAGTL